MDAHQTIVTLNNAGVHLLMANADGEALYRLRECLSVLKRTTSESFSSLDESVCNDCHQIGEPMAMLSGLHDGSQPFIYNRPFCFSKNLASNSFNSHLHLYGAVVLFNIALAHHRIGKLIKSQSYLEKATMFYDSCFEMLETRGARLGCFTIMKMAALNNASQIRLELAECKVARMSLDLLVNVMADAEPDALASLSKEEAGGFILNILLLRNGVPTAAAA
jgi:hypothetical protein